MSSFHRLLVTAGLLAAVAWGAGCAGPRGAADVRPELPANFPHHTLEQIQGQLRPPSVDTLKAFRARASVAIRSGDRNVNASADVRHRRGDTLYMTISPGLGIEAARVLVTPDSFFVYDRINKQLTYGSIAYASAFLPVPIEGDEAFLTLLGLAPPDTGVGWILEADSSYYLLHSPDDTRLAVIDPTIWRVVRYEQRTPEGDLVEDRRYSEYDRIEGVFLPRRIIVRRPQEQTNAILYYRDLDLDPGGLSFPFRVQDDVERILVDERQFTK